ncbi:MAG: hypothetical protein JWM19_5577 [Actinomycetia bacterium]|nr:hypothetical protein [Actinomycetes bacterium]
MAGCSSISPRARTHCSPSGSAEHRSARWEGTDWDGDNDWDFTSAADDTPEQLYDLWDGAVERSRARLNAALANGGLDQSVHLTSPDGRHASLRRLVCDLIEEYGRHAGHADLIREAVDGRVGEDPPAGWRPRAGREPWQTRASGLANRGTRTR